MKKLFILAMLSVFASSYSLNGGETMHKDCYQYGSKIYGKESIDNIQGNGSVILEGTKVSGLVQVNGCLKAEESTIHSLQVNGQTDLYNCVITNSTIINGSLNADNTIFQNGLSVASQHLVLKTCTVNTLILREVNGFTGKQIIDLRSGTTVTGPIVVESENGEIWISSNSEISEAHVKGGQVYRK